MDPTGNAALLNSQQLALAWVPQSQEPGPSEHGSAYGTTILHFNPDHPLFTNWQMFINKFSSKFGVFNTITEAERKLVSLRMSTDKRFTTFVVQFEKEAYKTGWNYNALRFQLSKALPKHIHDVL
ncbi:hypothetical protein C0995_007254 [Termitomyces sp. Mi166|nr:hypothetical protein C0995_007254 [Termitomyces sp. Mi166\